MGHIVFANPAIASFALLERLHRDLIRRGHRLSLLCLDRSRYTFWRHQRSGAGGSPQSCLVHLPPAGAAAWLSQQPTDLVLFHAERTPMLRHLADQVRAGGRRTLWMGEGLLPHTMQLDEQGLDAEASICRFRAADLRAVDPDPLLLDACLVHALSNARPVALPRATVTVPDPLQRLFDAAACALAGRFGDARRALTGWREAMPPDEPGVASGFATDGPFVTVLLQHADDPRIARDAPGAPNAAVLLRAVAAAVAGRLPAGTRTVAVLPPGAGTKLRRELPELPGVLLLPASDGAAAAAASLAVVTINAPTATTALLAGTPVVHCGDALYGMSGVATRISSDALREPGAAVGDALMAAIGCDRPALRRRLLTWLLRYAHVWCSCTAPSHNGMLGLVQAIERRLSPASSAHPLPYHPGPAWPLTIR